MSDTPARDQLGPAIGRRVRELRAYRGLAVEALAAAAAVSAGWLCLLEDGATSDLRVSALVRLAAALRCTPATLLPERVAGPPRL